MSIPDWVFEAAKRLAKERRVPRSHIIADAIEEYVARHDGSAVTARLNAVYDRIALTVDAALAAAQCASLDHEAWRCVEAIDVHVDN